MANGPNNYNASYSPVMGDRFETVLYWDAEPQAQYYYVYRETSRIKVEAPFTYKNDAGTSVIVFHDLFAWHIAQALDVFYWVSWAYIDPLTGQEVESDKTGPLYHLHPFALHLIEEAQALIGDDLRRVDGDQESVFGQVSLYNYKIAIHQAIEDINSEPTPTHFSFGSFPRNWLNLLTKGTIYYIMPKLYLLETAKTMTFNDQGQQWSPPELKAALKDIWDFWKEDYKENKKTIKQNVRPGPAAVGSLRALYISPQFMKFRHLSSGRPFF